MKDMKRKIISIFIMAMGVISLHDISIKAMSVEAYSVEKNVENQKKYNYSGFSGGTLEEEDIETVWADSEKDLYSFIYNGSDIVYFYIEPTIHTKKYEGKGQKDDLHISMYDTDKWENVIDVYATENGWAYFIVDDVFLTEGTEYVVSICNSSDYAYDCEYKVKTYSQMAESMTIENKKTLTLGDYKKIKVSEVNPFNSLPYANYKSSNRKVAVVDSLGYIYAKKKGNCTVTATLKNGKKYTCVVTVKNPAPYLKWKSYEIAIGSSFTNELMYATKKVTWSSSNKKIATVNSKGQVKTKGIGSCYIKAKSGGKEYKCKVKVYRPSPNFRAQLYNYNTRNNYFVVRIKNCSKRSLTICSAGAYSMDADYKKYDRKLYLPNHKNIKIGAGKTKYVHFKIKGKNTWPDYTDHTIRYYFNFAGKKYLGSTWDEESVYKKNGSWYTTYFDAEAYEEWIY